MVKIMRGRCSKKHLYLGKRMAVFMVLMSTCTGLLTGCGNLSDLSNLNDLNDFKDLVLSKVIKTSETDAISEEEVETMIAPAEDTAEPDAQDPSTEAATDESIPEIPVRDIFEEKLAELVEARGVFQAEQAGTMYEYNDEWFAPSGMISAEILDFDSDGSEEMLVCAAEECTHSNNGSYHIVMEMYEAENGEAAQAATALLGEYIEADYVPTKQLETALRPNYWTEEIIAVNAVLINEKYYLVCENHSVAGAFADGQSQSYWILEYADGAIQFVGSFTQTDGGSSDFAYTGYAFADGACVKSDLYYGEWNADSALYSDFGQAITNFFEGYDIQLDDTIKNYKRASDGYGQYQSILSVENDQRLMFELINRKTSTEWHSPFDFAAVLRRGNDLLDLEK